MFAALGPAQLEGIAAKLEEVRYAAGDEVICQGDRGERFFIVDKGEVEVIEDGHLARTQGPGESFGEIALVRDIPRTATVVARTDLELLALGRDEFLETLTRNQLSAQAAEVVVAARLGSLPCRRAGDS